MATARQRLHDICLRRGNSFASGISPLFCVFSLWQLWVNRPDFCRHGLRVWRLRRCRRLWVLNVLGMLVSSLPPRDPRTAAAVSKCVNHAFAHRSKNPAGRRGLGGCIWARVTTPAGWLDRSLAPCWNLTSQAVRHVQQHAFWVEYRHHKPRLRMPVHRHEKKILVVQFHTRLLQQRSLFCAVRRPTELCPAALWDRTESYSLMESA